MQIAVVGAGYVGLVTGTCFAETGHDVTIVDVDAERIDRLRKGEVPFFEPGLADLLLRNQREQRLVFSCELTPAIQSCQVVFIAVGTPQSHDGAADLRFVLQVADDIGRAMVGPLVVVCKSTVPVGTAKLVTQTIKAQTEHPVAVVSNPEFLKEGAAVDDFLRPDRVVVGIRDEHARKVMADLYEPFVRSGNPILFMDNQSAEMSKYCANGLLAARISFMNETALLCDAVGADVDQVRKAVGADRRIGKAFLFPGIGYGGSCFPKDVRALSKTGEDNGVRMDMLRATNAVNEHQKHVMAQRIKKRFGNDLSRCCFAIWGLAFKPRTDDIREAPSLVLIRELLEAQATIRVFDPEAMENVAAVLGDRVVYCENGYVACEKADALCVVTEWNEFRRPDFLRIGKLLRQPIVFDGRNLYDPENMREIGFEHYPIGRNVDVSEAKSLSEKKV